MNLFTTTFEENFGKEVKFSLLEVKGNCLLQVSLSWNDYPSWPYFQLSSGYGRLLNFFFYVYRVGFEIDVLGRKWASD